MIGTEIDTACRQILQDEGVIAHPAAYMLVWMNAAQDEIVVHAPRANTVTANIELEPNAHLQTLPAEYIALVDITQNMGTGGLTVGKPVSRTTMDRLAASKPNWRSDRAQQVRHFMYDERDETSYHVWPAPLSTTQLEARAVKKPAAIAALGDELELADIWKNAIVEYVLHKAYSQNSDSAAATELAMLHYAAFARHVGLKLEKQRKAGPGQSSTSNPAYPAVEKNGTSQQP